MKTLFVLSTLLIATALAAPPPPQAQIAIPQKCEDVFSVKACDKFEAMAESLKLKVDTAKEAFKDAVQKGKATYEEVKKSIEEFYLEKVKSKKCEDFVSAETCTKLRALGEKLKVKADEVEVFVKKALLEGKKKTMEVYEKVVDYYRTNIQGKSCEELLTKTPQVCASLRKAATAVKVKSEEVTKIVKEAIINGYNNATAVMKKGLQKLNDIAANFTCEDLLNPNLCKALREYATKTKVAFPKVMSTVRSLLLKGVQVAKGFLTVVYKITDAFIDCEDIFTEDSCKLLKQKITSVGGKLSDFGKVVREFATKAVNKTRDIYHQVLTYTKSKICRYLGIGCSKSTALVVKRSLSFSDMWKKYTDMLSKGIAEAKAKLKKAIENLIGSMTIVDVTIRNVINEAINDGKLKVAELKALLKKLVDAATGKNTTLNDAGLVKRDIKEKLREALKTAHANLHFTIKFLLSQSQEELKKIHNFISALLKKCLNDAPNKREIDDLEIMENMADELVKSETEKLTLEAEKVADLILDEAIEEVEEETDVHAVMQKRDISDGLDKVKKFFNKVGDKVGEALLKLRSTNIEDIKNALKNAGIKLINVAEDVYKKIKAALDKQN